MDLHRSYRELFSLEVPFAPDEELVAADSDERTWSALPFACVESENRVAYGFRISEFGGSARSRRK